MSELYPPKWAFAPYEINAGTFTYWNEESVPMRCAQCESEAIVDWRWTGCQFRASCSACHAELFFVPPHAVVAAIQAVGLERAKALLDEQGLSKRWPYGVELDIHEKREGEA